MDNWKHQARIAKSQSSINRESVDALRKYKEEWTKYRKDDKFAKKFDWSVEGLFDTLVDTLTDAIEKGPEAETQAIADIAEFLRDEKSNNKIDSCIRWHILFHAAACSTDKPEGDSKRPAQANEIKAATLLVKIIADMEEFLPFENPHAQPRSNSSGCSIKSQCIDHVKHKHKRQKSTPFLIAAANSNAEAIRCMIDFIRRYCKHHERMDAPSRRLLFPANIAGEDLLLHILRQPDSEGKSALHYAAREDTASLETLAELLKYPRIANSDETFEIALNDGKRAVVERFLDKDELRATFVTSRNIIRAMNLQRTEVDHQGSRTKIVQSMVKHARTSDTFNDEVVQKIIEQGSMEIWKARSQEIQLETSYLLHLAVFHQKVDFVKLFMKDYRKSVAVKALVPGTEKSEEGDKKQGYYPLWYNNKCWKDSKWVSRYENIDALENEPVTPEISTDKECTDEIRRMLVTATIKRTDKMHALLEILEQSAEEVHELCFDLSQLKLSRERPMDEFVHSLISHKEKAELLSYEPTIKYARFPALDMHTDGKEIFSRSGHEEHTEVFDILLWLNTTKKVSSIIELKVPDRLANPHNELKIASYVERFGVEILDWRFLDLSLSIFDAVKFKIRGLHLYSSGKRAAISHWLSNEGLKSFPNLSFVRIHVIQEMMTKEYCKTTCKYSREQVEILKQNWPHPKKKQHDGLDAVVNSQLWNPTHERLADLDEIAQRAFPKLSGFILSYRTHIDSILEEKKTFRPTKVAIIDNGILSISPVVADGPVSNRNQKRGSMSEDQENLKNKDSGEFSKGYRTLWSRIKEGRSFVDDDFQVSPWLFASHPHGTQMANLICAIDPRCELYVAKVTDGNRYGISPQRLSRAIEWAIKKKVDIISMSLSLLESSSTLVSSISSANAKGIVMMCSSHDQGSKVVRAWPAEATETITITACDEYGDLLRPLDHDKYAFKLQGQNVAAGVIPFLESNDRISGSSVATAIASGLSSLILSCARLNNPKKEINCMARNSLVKKYLEEMQAKPGSKHLLLEKFCNIDAKAKEGESISAEAILRQAFSSSEVDAAL